MKPFALLLVALVCAGIALTAGPEVTLRHYSKWLPQANTRYVHLLDAVCGSDCGSTDAAVSETA